MDAVELARWTRFAAKGGIGKCTAIHDCVAERPEDLMFLKDDEIIVLMQLPDHEGLYLGYCEGVVGRFQGIHVHFHSKLKKPIMTKRSSVSASVTPSPRSTPVSRLNRDVEPPPNFPRPTSRSLPSAIHKSRPSVDEDASPVISQERQRSISPPAPTAATSPIIASFQDRSSQLIRSPPTPIPLQPPSNVISTEISPPVHKPLPSLDEQESPGLLARPRSISPPAPTPLSDVSFQDSSYDPRVSIATSDGEVGIGLSLLQDLAGDDASSTRSDDDDEREEANDETLSYADPPPPPPPIPDSVSPSRQLSSPTSTRRSDPDNDSNWEGASDIYDDYRYSRYSMASKMSRFSQASKMSGLGPSEVPPPVPRPSGDNTRFSPDIPRRSMERTRSIDSDASIYSKSSKLSALSTNIANVVNAAKPAALDLSNTKTLRPMPLDLSPSPLLHTSWGSPQTSPDSNYNIGSPGPMPSASALRQQFESNSPMNSPVVHQFSRGIVIEDDEDFEEPVVTSPSPPSSPSSSPEPQIASSTFPPLVIANRTPSPSYADANTDPPPPSPLDVAPPPPTPSPSSNPNPYARPSLSELRGEPEPGSGMRTSLFLPHPNAPKPSPSSSGPMYIRTPPLPQGVVPTGGSAIHTIRMALSAMYGPHATPILNMRVPGPTIYGRTLHDLANSTGPVLISFSIEPPKATAPPPSAVRAASFVPPREVIDPVVESSTGVIPRPNFFPKGGTVRPRSRSFSGFNTSITEVPLPIQSDEDGVSPLKIPTAQKVARSMSASPTPSTTSSKKPAVVRSATAPSPLSLPQNNSVVKSPTSPLAQSSFLPSSPTAINNRPLHQLRQVVSNKSLNDAARSPLAKTRPSLSRNNGSEQEQSPTSPINSTRPFSPSEPTSTSPTQQLRSRKSIDSVQSDSRSRHAFSPPPPVVREPSLRSKLSMPNLRRMRSRETASIASMSGGSQMDVDTVQVQDMDFELVRPSLAMMQSTRTSEESAFGGRERDGSVDIKPDGLLGINTNGLLRADSPAVSMSSGQRSPTTVSDAPPLQKPPPTTGKVSEVELSMDAHRQRELKWVSVMSSTPASQARKSKKVKKLLLDGVPSSVRYLVWAHLADSKARGVPGVYAQLGKRGKVPASADIERDVQVCFGDHAQLQNMHGSLQALLQAYFTMVPDIQYHTGLTWISGHLLLLAPEEDAFWIFVSLMDTHLRPYFSSSTTQMEVDAALFSRALESNDPQVAKKVLVDMSISPMSICWPWLSSLFVGALPVDYLHRVWDLFLLEGVPFLMRVGLAIFVCCRRPVLECTSEESLLNTIHHPLASRLPQSPDAFLSLVYSVKLKDDEIRKQRVKMEAQVKRQAQTRATVSTPVPGSISLPRT